MEEYSTSFQTFHVPKEMRNLSDLSVKVKLPYQTTQNFMSQNLYGDFAVAYLHDRAFQMLSLALDHLRTQNSHFTFLIFDALRPRHIQRKMYEFVEPLGQSAYVAHPDSGSLHNFGLAVDLTVFDLKVNQSLAMGTDFDDFSDLAHTYAEDLLLKNRRLSQQAFDNRILLRKAMTAAGFQVIRNEWWHFNACTLDEAKKLASIVE